MDNNISVDGLSGLADYIEKIAQEQPSVLSITNLDLLPIALAAEPQVEEAAAMVRRNGGVMIYTRTVDGSQVAWHRIRIQASNIVTAWFFRELVEIGRGN